MAAPFSGGCACGAVRYRYAADPIMAVHCHCRTCQRASGTHVGSHLMLPRAAGEVTGELRFYETRADSGNEVRRGFCPTCGSPILAYSSGFPDMVAVVPPASTTRSASRRR